MLKEIWMKSRQIAKNLYLNIWNKVYIIYLKTKGLQMGTGCQFRGRMHLYIGSGGKAELRENVSVNSGLKWNPIGGDTKMIIRVYDNAELKVGNRVGISNACIVAKEKVTIGDNVLIGGSCKIYDTDFHSLNYIERRNKKEKVINKGVRIEDDVFVGAHSIILKGTVIGARSIIGAGSVVSGIIPSDEIWAGNPAKFIRKIEN